ncbi:MAG: hypothetical protein Q8K58_05075 [Acidimicrobiales bacterium]|nr:hypothetical protein [Acidimicrobiales bacterium]
MRPGDGADGPPASRPEEPLEAAFAGDLVVPARLAEIEDDVAYTSDRPPRPARTHLRIVTPPDIEPNIFAGAVRRFGLGIGIGIRIDPR